MDICRGNAPIKAGLNSGCPLFNQFYGVHYNTVAYKSLTDVGFIIHILPRPPMQPQTFQQFRNMPVEARQSLVQQRPQSQPRPVPLIGDFPEINFSILNSTQDSKPIKLATYRYAAQQTKGVVIFFHSIAYHVGLLANTARMLAQNGITFVGYDQRGHGRSEGERGYIDDIEAVFNDARVFIANMFAMYPKVPIFLMGHGFGSVLCMHIIDRFKQFPFAGLVIFSAPFTKPVNKIVAALSGFAFKILPDSTGIQELEFQKITSNPTACDYLRKQPHVYHGKLLVGTLRNVIPLVEKIESLKWDTIITPPLVIIQGQFDKTSDPINAINFIEAVQTQEKQMWWFPEMWNCFIFEREYDDINERLVKWFRARV